MMVSAVPSSAVAKIGAKAKRSNWATKQDFKPLSAIVIGSLAAAIWPRRWDRQLLDWRFQSFLRSHRERIDDLAATMRRILGPKVTSDEAFRAATEYFRISKEIGWHRVRNIFGRGTNDEIQVDGLEHIQSGLALGRGVVLWNPFFGGYVLP